LPRAAAGTVRAADFEQAMLGIKGALSAPGAKAFAAGAKELAQAAARDEAQALSEAKDDLRDAATEQAAARVSDAAESRWARFAAAAAVLGAPQRTPLALLDLKK